MSKKFGAGLPKIRTPQPTPKVDLHIGLNCKSRNFSGSGRSVIRLVDRFAHGRHPAKMIEPEAGGCTR